MLRICINNDIPYRFAHNSCSLNSAVCENQRIFKQESENYRPMRKSYIVRSVQLFRYFAIWQTRQFRRAWKMLPLQRWRHLYWWTIKRQLNLALFARVSSLRLHTAGKNGRHARGRCKKFREKNLPPTIFKAHFLRPLSGRQFAQKANRRKKAWWFAVRKSMSDDRQIGDACTSFPIRK